MLTVTFRLENYPVAGDEWRVLWGEKIPYDTYYKEWHISPNTAKDSPITVSMAEATRYLVIVVSDSKTGMVKYSYETKDPFTFEDNTTYVWDCSTNSLSKEVPAPPPERFLDVIFSYVWDISDFFENARLVVHDWVWPFYLIETPLYWVSQVFWDLLTPIAHFGDWVDAVADKVSQILGPEGIISLLKTWLTYAEDAWNWILGAVQNVTSIIGTWWSSISLTVQGWIDIAKKSLLDLIDAVSKSLASLGEAWGNFTKTVLPTLATIANVDDLVKSALKTWFPFYDALVSLWASIAEFFTNPFDFLLDKFTDWFLGKE